MLFIRDAVFNDKHSNELQRRINIDEILSDKELVFEKPSSASKALSPLFFAVTVRSEYSNLVLVHKTEQREVAYVTRKEEENVSHRGIDLLFYETAHALMECLDYATYKSEIDALMFSHSICQPIGLYYPNFSKGNPVFYSHIVLKDDSVEEFKKYLKPEFKFVAISKLNPIGNTPALYKTIFEI